MDSQRGDSQGITPKKTDEVIDFSALLPGGHPRAAVATARPPALPPPLPRTAASASKKNQNLAIRMALCVSMAGVGAFLASNIDVSSSDTVRAADLTPTSVPTAGVNVVSETHVVSTPDLASVVEAPVQELAAVDVAVEAPRPRASGNRSPRVSRTMREDAPVATVSHEAPSAQNDEESPWEGGGAARSVLPLSPARGDVRTALESVIPEVRACGQGTHGTAMVRVSVAPSGRVRNAVVSGDFAGSETGSCVARAVRRASFPAFTSETFEVSFPYNL